MIDIFDPVRATNSGHPGVDRWNTLINVAAPQFGVPPNLLKAHMLFESGGDASVISGDGGYGLMQITNGVVNGLYHDVDILDPYTNVKVAARDFIEPLMRQFPADLDAVIAGYNAGAGAVAAALARGEDPSVTTYGAWYVPSVRNAFAFFNEQSHRSS